MPALRKHLLLALLAVVLAGCAGAPSREGPRVYPSDAGAEALLGEGRFAEAAEIYGGLAAEARAPLAHYYALRAADAFIDAGEPARAEAALAQAQAGDLPAELERAARTVEGRLALAGNEPARALELLPTEGAAALELTRRIPILRAQALERLGRHLEAARERARYDAAAGEPEAAAANRWALWEALARVPLADLESAEPAPPASFGGWLELASIARRLITDPAGLDSALRAWSERHPAHPASESIVPGLRLASLTEANPPAHVALLLPFMGAFADAAAAVRDGFLAAWFRDRGNPERPKVSIWDTSGADVRAVYAQAVNEGADFVVGPLEKPAVNALAATGNLAVSTLALNRAEQTPPAPVTELAGDAPPAVFYQFALAPEGEAARVAERAWFDGHGLAGMLVPEGEWGERVARAFADAWSSLGGVVTVTQRYDSEAADMSEPVERLLGVDQSKARWQALRGYLGRDLKHQPRRRQDIDLVFMAAFPRQGRQLNPQLKFHYAGDVPVYSTSHVFTGAPEPERDLDLDGVTFGDMPWVLIEPYAPGSLRSELDAIWGTTLARYLRLYAFGADAYRLLPGLGRLRAQAESAFDGHTGRLSAGPDNRLERRLTWARFEAGAPVLVDAPAAPE